jgi:hypothetical protein
MVASGRTCSREEPAWSAASDGKGVSQTIIDLNTRRGDMMNATGNGSPAGRRTRICSRLWFHACGGSTAGEFVRGCLVALRVSSAVVNSVVGDDPDPARDFGLTIVVANDEANLGLA